MLSLTVLLLLFLSMLTPLYLTYRQPNFLIRHLQRRWPDVLWHVPTSHKVIALTIDDGPSLYTRQILNLLAANGAHATFFVLGANIDEADNDLLPALVRAGNELANHGERDEPARALSDAVLTTQLADVRRKIHAAYAAAGSKGAQPLPPPDYFRPGSGFFSARMRALVRSLGYRLVLGSVYPHDAQISWAWLNAWHVLGGVRPGSIVVCHDGRSWTLPMLERVLPELRRRGYEVVTVSELLRIGANAGAGEGG